MSTEMDAGRSENGVRATRVIKFGGTSVTGGDRIDTIESVVRERLESKRPVLVVSAFAHITTLLETTALAACTGTHHAGFADLRAVHLDAIESMTRSAPTSSLVVELLLAECFDCLEAISAAGVCSAADMDEVLSFGERLSSSIIAEGLVVRGIDATPVDAAALVVTDDAFGHARADLAATRRQAEAVLPGASTVPVITGFIGATPNRARTTLGREGSDYSAAVLGWALDADEVEIWTDVDGVKTADPRVVDDVLSLRHLSYDALYELANRGAKVVHPNTLRPLRERAIPLSIRNTLSRHAPGTRVGGEARASDFIPSWLGVTQMPSRTVLDGRPLDGGLEGLDQVDTPFVLVTAIRNIDSASSDGQPDAEPITAAHLADALLDTGVAVLNRPGGSVSGSTASSISFAVAPQDGDAAVRALHGRLFGHIPRRQRHTTDSRYSHAGCDS